MISRETENVQSSSEVEQAFRALTSGDKPYITSQELYAVSPCACWILFYVCVVSQEFHAVCYKRVCHSLVSFQKCYTVVCYSCISLYICIQSHLILHYEKTVFFSVRKCFKCKLLALETILIKGFFFDMLNTSVNYFKQISNSLANWHDEFFRTWRGSKLTTV